MAFAAISVVLLPACETVVEAPPPTETTTTTTETTSLRRAPVEVGTRATTETIRVDPPESQIETRTYQSIE